eukprot:m.51281 g.51281  ORF g.51281 m.51281 type:complete len:709 (+) comp7294_c0_seq1:59-2185(+)
MIRLAIIAATVAMATAAPKHSFPFKMLNGEPSEFSSHRVAPGSARMASSETTRLRVEMETPTTLDGEVSWTHPIDVDSSLDFSIALMPTVEGMQAELRDPRGAVVDLKPHEHATDLPLSDSGLSGDVPGVMWDFANVQTLGVYTLRLTAPAQAIAARRTSDTPTSETDALVAVNNKSPQTNLHTYPLTTRTVLGGKIGLAAGIVDTMAHPFSKTVQSQSVPPARIDAQGVKTAVLVVRSPSGKETRVPMTDDGTEALDAVVGDGYHSASVVATESGRYELTAEVTGVSDAGVEFARSSTHVAMVEAKAVEVEGAVATLNTKTQRLSVHLMIKDMGWDADALLKPYAEVHAGTTPIGWMHNLARVQRNNAGAAYLTMEFDLRWVAKSGASPKVLTLQNVWVVDAYNEVIVAEGVTVPLHHVSTVDTVNPGALGASVAASWSAAEAVEQTVLSLIGTGYQGDITDTMRHGIKPAARNATRALVDGKVLLIHGFCATKNPFQKHPGDWTDAAFYDGYAMGHSRSRMTEEFAEDVLQYIEQEGLGKFSSVGQSQGGQVQLHILNYYFTGLDDVSGGRRIQSVATPYRGISSYGSLSDWAEALYPDCIPPYSFSPDGAQNWEMGIAMEYLEQTHVYRTRYKWGIPENCNWLINMFLNGYHDGAVEVSHSTPFANVGTIFDVTEGQCHKEDMSYPPSFEDHNRNAEMNAAASRK